MADYSTDSSEHPPALLRRVAEECLEGRGWHAALARFGRVLEGNPHLRSTLVEITKRRQAEWFLREAQHDLKSRLAAGALGQGDVASRQSLTSERQSSPAQGDGAGLAAFADSLAIHAGPDINAPEGAGGGAMACLPEGHDVGSPPPPIENTGGAASAALLEGQLSLSASSVPPHLHPNALVPLSPEQRRARAAAAESGRRSIMEVIEREFGRAIGDLRIGPETQALERRNGARAQIYRWINQRGLEGRLVSEEFTAAELEQFAAGVISSPPPNELLGG